MKILVGKATVEISSEGPDVSLGTELVAYCTHLLHLKPQQRILKRCESVNDEDNIGGDSTPELLRVKHDEEARESSHDKQRKEEDHHRYQHCKPPNSSLSMCGI